MLVFGFKSPPVLGHVEHNKFASSYVMMQLPSDAVSQRFVSVSAIPAGFIYLPDREVFEDSLDKDTGRKVPSFSFLVEHGEHAKILFDLGTRKVRIFWHFGNFQCRK